MADEKKIKVVVSKREMPLMSSQVLSKEQIMLKEMFGGQRTFGTGQNLPKLNRSLMSGNGLIKSGDTEKETARLFGFK